MAGIPRNGRPGTIRGESVRRGISESRIRAERAAAEGLSPSVGRGHGGGIKQARANLRTDAGLRSATPSQLAARNNQLEALRRVRGGEASSVADAEKQLGLPRGSVRKNCPTAFDSRGHLKSADREPALMSVIGPDGVKTVVVRGSRARSLVGQHRIAVDRVLRGEAQDDSLDEFRGKFVAGIELECDEPRLRAMFPDGLPDGSPYPERALR